MDKVKPADCKGFVPGNGFGRIRICGRCDVPLDKHRVVPQ